MIAYRIPGPRPNQRSFRPGQTSEIHLSAAMSLSKLTDPVWNSRYLKTQSYNLCAPFGLAKIVGLWKSDHPAGNFKQMSILYMLCL